MYFSNIEKERMESVIHKCPLYLYTSVPEPGDNRYVFRDKVCLGIREAYDYATSLTSPKGDNNE